jgi:hypothetical protein
MAEVNEKYLTASPVDKIKQDASEKSGFYDGFLSGLTNSEEARVRWLATKRFPDEEDPVDNYYIDKDGDIAYRDPTSGEYKKEFAQGPFGIGADSITGSIFPTLQFAGELIGGVGGLIGGGAMYGIPGAMAAGVGGTGIGGGTIYAVRTGLSQMLDGPALDTEKMTSDLSLSSAFGGIPFGAPAKSFPRFAEDMITRFPGVDGRKQLQNIVSEGGKTAEEKIAFAQEKYGITLTRPEAQRMLTEGTQLQKYLQVQPNSQKLWKFYHDRNLQVQEIADDFFAEIGSGKYAKEGIKNKLSGKGSLDASLDVAKASDNVLKKLASKRQERASKIYTDAFDMQDVNIDVSDLVKGLDDQLADKNIKGKLRTSLETVKKSLIDQNTSQIKNTTEGLHNSLSQDFRPLIEGLTKDNQKFIKREVSKIRSQVSNRLKEANPIYKKATEVYDPTKGHLQVLERSIINMFAQAVEKGGARSGMLAEKLFKGTARPKEIRDLKRLLQTDEAGADAWQNLKGGWLQTQFDDAVVGTVNPLQVPNKFLQRIGVRGNADVAFQGRGTRSQLDSGDIKPFLRGRQAKVWEAILEPDELDNFVDLVDTMQAVSYIATQSASPTQTLQTMGKIMEKEGTKGFAKLKRYGLGIFNIIPRIINRGASDITDNILATQKDLYQDLLIESLINPKKAVELRTFLDNVRPSTYLATQSWLRGGDEALEKLSTSIDERNAGLKTEQEEFANEQLMQEFQQQSQQQQSEIDDLQGAMQNFEQSMPQIDQPLFEESSLTPMETLSPTILPNEKDREIALRNSGIASLV